jgi:phage N-6-adenine-methyltransferase
MNGKDTACFSKNSDEWETPQWLFDLLDQEFRFDVDAAATEENAKCFFRFDDALDRPWYEGDDPELKDVLEFIGIGGVARTFWLNPPYSKIGAFMKKAYEESLKGATVVCLIPCRTDTRYWHDYVMKAHEIRLIQGRLKFSNSKTSAPFPSCIVIFDHNKYDKNNDPIFKTMKASP